MSEPVKLLSLTPGTGAVCRYVGRKRTGKFHTSGICADNSNAIEALRVNGWLPIVPAPTGETQ